MKICILGDGLSIHIERLSMYLIAAGHEVHLITFRNNIIPGINIHFIDVGNTQSIAGKLNIVKSVFKIKKLIKTIQPDILHAHYATSYGSLAALTGFHPFVLSVWGLDVFEFPRKSFLHKKIIEYNFAKADTIIAITNLMQKEINKYTNKNIEIIPFGIDTDIFKPKIVKSIFNKEDIVIGTIKHLEDFCGIDYLIRAFKILKDRYRDIPLKLLLVGSGSQEIYLKNLAKELNIDTDIVFTGHIDHKSIPEYHNMITIFVALSHIEGFGVAVAEASASAKPVVVSNVGGLPEIVENNITGFVVPPRDPQQAAEAIEKLISDNELREIMGKAGRERIVQLFNITNDINKTIAIYKSLKK